MSDTITLTLDGQKVEARAGEMLIAVADRAGVSIPRFCYHPKLTVAANCRMCLVEVAQARGPVPACATPVTDGMEVFTRSEHARAAQRATMEFLLINHPLDCPICDQGGECELQDLALGYGAGVSRYAEARRAVPDPDLGPLVSTDMTRCIHCTRCVRFTEEIAGEQELGAFGRGEFMKIGTYVENAMHSEMSGCVIDLCPVGALNARPSRMKGRAWEMESHPGLGEHDGAGSHVARHTLRGEQVRCVPREEESINEVWLSDRDRFSYQAASHPRRLTEPMRRQGNQWVAISWEEALEYAVAALQQAPTVAGLIHPSATVEECYRFQDLLRGCGAQTVEHRVRMTDFRGAAQYPRMPELGCAIADIGKQDLIVIVGSFLRHDQPILNHHVRQAALSGTDVRVLNPCTFDWNFPLAEQVVASPREWVKFLGTARSGRSRWGRRLNRVDNAVLWLGPMALNHPDASLLYAAARRVCEATGAHLGVLPEGANAPGAWLAGCVAHRGPGGVPLENGVDLSAQLQEPASVWALYGLDTHCDVDNPPILDAALKRAQEVIGFQSFLPDAADTPFTLLLPIATVGERRGHLINLEGRWQAMEPAVAAPGATQAGAQVLAALARTAGLDVCSEAQLLEHCRTDASAAPQAHQGKSCLPAEGLLRVGSPSLYQQDAVTRRAHALQQTEWARQLELRAHPDTLRSRGVKHGAEVKLVQNGAALVLPYREDPSMPLDCVYVATGDARLALLGSAFGAVELQRV